MNLCIIGLFENGKINNALKTLFENNDYTKLVTSLHEKGAKDITKVIQVSYKLFNLLSIGSTSKEAK